jgi:hypothetical protein
MSDSIEYKNSRIFRLATLGKIISKTGGLASTLESAIDSKKSTAITPPTTLTLPTEEEKEQEIPNKPIFTKTPPVHISFGSVTITSPSNPIIGGIKTVDAEGKDTYKGGAYNVFIWIRDAALTRTSTTFRGGNKLPKKPMLSL